MSFKKNNMTKSDLVSEIADKTGIPKIDVLLTIETLVKELKVAMIGGESVFLRGFGTFYPRKRAAKVGRDIKRNVAVVIPEQYLPDFRPAKEFLSDVKTKCKKAKG
ncbi:HU family DNA-binding protein [Parasediminibacterium sp. JCM 36343]|uniref:HU family DNA-binding protein n=1 Tax=Parasediminibacterium sp. JCM 36343 TaxID=3374279 RepID=UPI00397CAD20